LKRENEANKGQNEQSSSMASGMKMPKINMPKMNIPKL